MGTTPKEGVLVVLGDLYECKVVAACSKLWVHLNPISAYIPYSPMYYTCAEGIVVSGLQFPFYCRRNGKEHGTNMNAGGMEKNMEPT